MKLHSLLRSLLLLALGLMSAGAATAMPMDNGTNILVPAYFYPTFEAGNPWSRLDDAASKVQINAIVNPNNGRFDMADPNYSTVINRLRTAGGKVFGYVQSNYGNTRAQVTDPDGNILVQGFDFAMARHDIDQYLNLYQVDGFFIDEMSALESKVPEYVDLYNYIKGKNPNLTVIGNTGVGGVEDSLKMHAADILLNYEDYGSNYATTQPPDWVDKYAPSSFANMAHGVASVSEMQAIVGDLALHHAGSIYVTDLMYADNPWRGLPGYWDAEVATVAARNAIPEPATILMLLPGLLILLARREASGGYRVKKGLKVA